MKWPHSTALPWTFVAHRCQTASGSAWLTAPLVPHSASIGQRNLAAGLDVDLIISHVGRLTGAIVLAAGMDALGLDERRSVMRDRAWIESLGCSAAIFSESRSK